MNEEDLQWLKAEIEAHPDKTLGELKEELKLPCSESSGKSRGSGERRRRYPPPNRSVPDAEEKRILRKMRVRSQNLLDYAVCFL